MYKSVPIEVFSDKQKYLRRLAVELYAHIQILLPCLHLQSVREFHKKLKHVNSELVSAFLMRILSEVTLWLAHFLPNLITM